MKIQTKYIDPGYEKFIAKSNELETAYSEACDWVSSFGIIYRKTRFGSYEKDIKDFLANRGNEPAKESVKIFMNAHMEANELIRIKSAFDSFNNNHVIESIKKSVSGQKFRNATSHDQSRDFAFELGVASRFLKANYEVGINSVSDLIVNIDGRRLYVECKRLKSYKQLEKRVRHANNQIKTRLRHDSSSKSRGMIALNITDIMNPNATPVIAKSIEEYRAGSAMMLKQFVLKEKHHYLKNRHKKCLAVITEFTTQGLIDTDDVNDTALVNVREGNIYQHLLQKEDTGFLNSFWGKLGNQYLL